MSSIHARLCRVQHEVVGELFEMRSQLSGLRDDLARLASTSMAMGVGLKDLQVGGHSRACSTKKIVYIETKLVPMKIRCERMHPCLHAFIHMLNDAVCAQHWLPYCSKIWKFPLPTVQARLTTRKEVSCQTGQALSPEWADFIQVGMQGSDFYVKVEHEQMLDFKRKRRIQQRVFLWPSDYSNQSYA